MSKAHSSGGGRQGACWENGSGQPCKRHPEMSANGVCDKSCDEPCDDGFLSCSVEPAHAFMELNEGARAMQTRGTQHRIFSLHQSIFKVSEYINSELTVLVAPGGLAPAAPTKTSIEVKVPIPEPPL